MTTTEPTTRIFRPEPRTFESFPESATCPICGTNDDGKTVLVAIQGTREDNIVAAQPFHLACAIAKQWEPSIQIAWTSTRHAND